MKQTSATHDLIIVGAGGSGLAAAVSAAENGASVLVLEKQASPGGTTGMAVGSFTANRTEWQRQAGIEDTLSAHLQDIAGFAPAELEARNNHELRQFFLEHAGETLTWLKGMGLSFFGPSPEPPNRVARMHNVVPGARAYVLALQARLRALGGEIKCDSPVDSLIRENHRITGVRVGTKGNLHDYHARLGVVLAAGDYANSAELIAEFKGGHYAAIEGINANATGSGQSLARSVGARLVNMDVTYGPEIRFIPSRQRGLLQWLPSSGPIHRMMGGLTPRLPRFVLNAFIKRLLVAWQHPENALFDDGAILLNARGERFCNERTFPGREISIAEQLGKHAYILIDERLCQRYSTWPHYISTAPRIAYAYVADYERLRPDVTVRGESLAEVARRRGLPVKSVEATVAEFNQTVAAGRTDRFGRTGDLNPLQGKTWVLLGPAKSYFTTTEGSPAINLRFEVLDTEGQPISGLYAIGQNGLGGQILWGHGLKIGWALTSGRLLGRHLTETRLEENTRLSA